MKRWTDFEQEQMDKAETASYVSHETSSIKSGRGARYRGTDSNYSAAYSTSYAASSAYDAASFIQAPPYTPSHMPPTNNSPQFPYAATSSPMHPPGSPSSAGLPQFSSPGGGMSPVPQMPLLMDYSAGGNNRNSYVSFGAAGGGSSSYVETESVTSSSVVGVLPSDEEILAEIRHILSTADLMAVTKKSVREQLSTIFKVDLSMKKEFIHRCIDSVLKGEI
jgi:chitin synthase